MSMGDHRVSDAVDLSKAKKDYSAFDAQLTHSALNFRMFARLVKTLQGDIASERHLHSDLCGYFCAGSSHGWKSGDRQDSPADSDVR